MSEPAFPRPDVVWEDKINGGLSGTQGHPGMTLRDYFAGQALVGILANPTVSIKESHAYKTAEEAVAKQSYEFADALLAEREGK